MLDFGANNLAAPVDEDAVAVDDIGFGMLLGSAGYRLQATRKIVVVGIQPADQIAGGAQEALVDGIRLPPIAFRDPLHLAITLDDGQGVVSRSVVDHNVLDGYARLARDA